jgi:uncharacterized DUF497 family protein
LVFWQRFEPEFYEYEFDEAELSAHDVTADEAAEVLWNGFDVRRNKREGTGYQLVGRTDGGRLLKLIVYERSKGLIRVITGWPL